MSPEQALGKPFDHRVDIYALGAIFFELLTGRVPFDGENFMEILAKHGHAQVPSLRDANPGTRVSPELERVVMRALAKDPDARYASMGDLASDLRSVPEMPSLDPSDAGPATDIGPPELSSAVPALRASLAAMAVPQGSVSDAGPPPKQPAFPKQSAHEPPSSAAIESARSPGSRRNRRRSQRTTLSRKASRARHWLLAAGLVSVLVLVAGYVAQRMHEPAVMLSSLSRHGSLQATAIEAAPAEPGVAVLARAPDTQRPEAQHLVEVQIRTQPSGARVRAIGTGAQCDAAPCALEVPRGRPVTLRAENHAGSVERTLTFDDNTEVELRLSEAVRPKNPTRPPHNKLRSDLKMPAIFKRP
jgi:serine/threonine-protein kinase